MINVFLLPRFCGNCNSLNDWLTFLFDILTSALFCRHKVWSYFTKIISSINLRATEIFLSQFAKLFSNIFHYNNKMHRLFDEESRTESNLFFPRISVQSFLIFIKIFIFSWSHLRNIFHQRKFYKSINSDREDKAA